MRKIRAEYNTEFELDLAPLLAVMVKLVPVLLLSSAFVQMMVIETELPQVVQQAIERQNQEAKKSLTVEVSVKEGIRLVTDISGKVSEVKVPLKDGHYDFDGLHLRLVEIKRQNPDIFQIDLMPDAQVSYKDIVKIMDMARKSRNAEDKFEVYDQNQKTNVETTYMFPEVVFVNMTEG